MQPPYFPLPVEVGEISAAWLTAALRQHRPEVTVLDFEIVDVVHTTTTKARVRLQLDEAGQKAGIPDVIIVKGGFQPHGRDLDHMHLREVRGYRDVYPGNPLPTPACYFADFDAGRRQGIVIMEDLLQRHVHFCHATQPQTYAEMLARLSILARFHARTWNSPRIAPGGPWADLVEFFAATQPWVEHYAVPEHWDRLIRTPRGVATSVLFHDRTRMVDAWNRVAHFGRKLPQCVLHGDVHLDNLYTDAAGNPEFLDGLSCRGPAMLEVSYFVAASVDLSDRRNWEGALVGHYLDELARQGIEPPLFDEAMRQYALFQIYGYFVWLATESDHQSEEVKTCNSARVGQAMIDLRTLELVERLPL